MKIERMDVAQCLSIISCGIAFINKTCINSKVLGVVGICIGSGSLTLAVEDIVMYLKGES